MSHEDEIMVCRGCYVDLLELRRMVLNELPYVDVVGAAYVAVNAKDLRALTTFAAEINTDHYE